MTMRCILLEKELAALRGQSQSPTPPLQFLGATLGDLNVNALPMPKSAAVAGAAAKADIPLHLLMEEKAINFLGNNPFKVWTFLLFLTFLVVRFKA